MTRRSADQMPVWIPLWPIMGRYRLLWDRMARVTFERVEALELLGMTLAHLIDAESRAELSLRMPLLMAIRDKLAAALRKAA